MKNQWKPMYFDRKPMEIDRKPMGSARKPTAMNPTMKRPRDQIIAPAKTSLS